MKASLRDPESLKEAFTDLCLRLTCGLAGGSWGDVTTRPMDVAPVTGSAVSSASNHACYA
ncbi:hypothetical protein DL990_10535 [Amycolatopsis sp. WAC 01416]|nr:hypothetical protein DL990_10535 [Amycolatopsis sp. WAC 01416]